MKALYYLPGIYPQALTVLHDDVASITEQLSVAPDAFVKGEYDGYDTAGFSIYHLTATPSYRSAVHLIGEGTTGTWPFNASAPQTVPNPFAEHLAETLTGEYCEMAGPLVFVFRDETLMPAELPKPSFDLATQLGRDGFAQWARITATTWAAVSPSKDAAAFWDFLEQLELPGKSSGNVHQDESSQVVLIGDYEAFRQGFIHHAQPAIDRVFSEGLRRPDAFALDEEQEEGEAPRLKWDD